MSCENFFDDIAFKLKPGEISGIIRSDSGFHIIKVNEKVEGSILPYGKVRNEIIELIKDIKVRKEIINYTRRLKKEAKVKIFMSEIL